MKNKAALAEEESTDLDDSLEAVDVDFNTVKNLLESYNQQMDCLGQPPTCWKVWESNFLTILMTSIANSYMY
ncbi:hypothetical protein EB796_018580 [Bugula neritina]|uniref:Uncharacterized protein n=1 Tax=Bugula neritina TaxID=10212 RepID=A0A7J7JCN3_BUGNE|nr:hypothetical protein EB796_018580 [Bugula neritina]